MPLQLQVNKTARARYINKSGELILHTVTPLCTKKALQVSRTFENLFLLFQCLFPLVIGNRLFMTFDHVVDFS